MRQQFLIDFDVRPWSGSHIVDLESCARFLGMSLRHYRKVLRDNMESPPERGRRVDIDTVGDLPMRGEPDIADQIVDQIAGQDAVLQALDKLSGVDRNIVILKMEGYSHHKIADALGLHPSNIARRLKQLRNNRGWVAGLADGNVSTGGAGAAPAGVSPPAPPTPAPAGKANFATNIDDDLALRAEQAALEDGLNRAEVAEVALEAWLAQRG